MTGGGILFSLVVGVLGQGSFAYTTGTTRDWLYQTTTGKSTDCGILSYHTENGDLSSPNYPYNYSSNTYCEWIINPGINVYLEVTDLSLETCCDHLQVFDQFGHPRMNPIYVGQHVYDHYFRVVFKTDGSGEKKGFRLHWGTDYVSSMERTTRDWRYQTTTEYTNCGSRSRYGINGYLSSPNYPYHYPNNVDCEWDINPGTFVYLKVTDLDLESCCDHLEIYDQHGNEMNASSIDYLYGSHFRVVFKTDSSNVHRGFQIHWSTDQDIGSTLPSWWGQTTNWWGYTTNRWRFSTDTPDRIKVNCNSSDLNVLVPRDVIRQIFPGVSEYDLTLNNPNCKSEVYSDVVMFHSGILGCGMTREETFYEVVYQNRIRPSSTPQSTSVPNTSPYYWYTTRPYWFTTESDITRFDAPDIKVECRLDSFITAVGYYHPQNTHEVVARGHGNIYAYMDFYRDYSYHYKITSYPISLSLNEDVYVDLRVDTGDPSLKITAQRCYASPTSDPYNYYTQHTLINYGCSVDPTVAIEYAPAQHFHFRFRTFEFLKDKDDVYIFCQVKVCNDTDYYNRCHRNCSTRHRRDAVETEEHDFEIFQGPLKFRNERSADVNPEKRDENDSTMPGSVPAVVMAVSAVAMVVASAVVVIVRRRRNRVEANSQDRVI